MSHEQGHPPLTAGAKPEAAPIGPRAWMKDPGEPPGMWDRRENVQRLLRVLYAVAALLVALDVAVHRHAEHPWEQLTAFYPLYGFVGIVILVVAARRLRRVAMRAEDYYGGE